MLHGWELLGVCLSFFPPSSKFQSYLEGHIFRCLDTRDHTENVRLNCSVEVVAIVLTNAVQEKVEADIVQDMRCVQVSVLHGVSFLATV